MKDFLAENLTKKKAAINLLAGLSVKTLGLGRIIHAEADKIKCVTKDWCQSNEGDQLTDNEHFHKLVKIDKSVDELLTTITFKEIVIFT